MSNDTPNAEPAGAGSRGRHDSAAPPGYGTVTPWIISPDTARLIEFTKAAFGAQELARVPGPDGQSIGHAEVRIGDSAVMMFDARDGWPPTPAFLRLYVPDAAIAYQRALAAGATPVTEVTALFFGDRVGRVRDPPCASARTPTLAARSWIPPRPPNTGAASPAQA